MEWFESWFDSPYYKILYQHRNDNEAQFFIQNLLKKIPLKPYDNILDLACGRGRHAKWINHFGFNVYGIDLSENSIAEAKPLENTRLHFFVQDMRYFSLPVSFALILSLFTSFGYFENPMDNFKVLKRIYQHLKPQGYFVLDFLNAHWVVQNLVEKETKVIQDVQFEITKFIENKKIIKQIDVKDGKLNYSFYEKVNLFTLDDLSTMLEKENYHILAQWGNYDLSDYEQNSPRVILWAEKKEVI
jgi:SAM-dependent methyltransferase